MTPLPKEPNGTSGLAQTIRQLIRAVRERTILPDPTVDISQLPSGTRIKVKGSSGAGTRSTSNIPRWG